MLRCQPGAAAFRWSDNLPNNGSADFAQSTPPTVPQVPAEPTSFGFSFSAQRAPPAAATLSSAFFQTPPAASAATPAPPSSTSSESPAQDHSLPAGLSLRSWRLLQVMSLAPFRSDGSCIWMVTDSEATNIYLDPALTPGVRAHTCDVKDLQAPQTIVAAGQHLLKGVTRGTIFGAVTDDNGIDRRVSFRVVLVPDLGTNLFSMTAVMQKVVSTFFHIRSIPN